MRKFTSLFTFGFVALFSVCSFGEMDHVEEKKAVSSVEFVMQAVSVLSQRVEEPTSLPYEGEVKRFLFAQHLFDVADVPHEYGFYTYDAALEIGEDPYDLAALLISEHSGPDLDFSYEGSKAYPYTFTYSPDSEGSGGEIGLYQLKPRWARKAAKFYGTDWKAEDLYDPEINTKAAAYVMHQLKKNHREDCGPQENSLHTWSAHYKCARKSRDDLRGRCRWAQKKYEKLRYSLSDFGDTDTKAIGKAHNERLRKLLKKKMRSNKHSLRVRLRKLCKVHELEVPKKLKKMSLEELQRELEWLEEATGGVAEGGS